jgi:class 3 adenylate cyclase
MAQTYQEIGSLYFLLDDFSKGFDYLQQTLTIYQQSDDQVRIARTHHFIGSIHLSNGDLLTALSSFDKTIKIYTELENKDGIAATLGVMGRAYTEQGNYPKAIEKFEESLRISKESNSQYGIATALVHIGAIYGKEGKYSKAHEYYSQGLKIFEELNDPSELTAAFVYIGMLYNKQNDYSRTIEYCTKGYKLALSTGAVLDQKEACQCLYETYKAMGNSNEALVYLEKINAAEDSLDTQEASKKLQQMEFTKQRLQDSIAAAEQNRLVQEAHQEEIREGEKTRNLFAGGGLLVLLLAGGLYTRNRFIKKSRDTISKEKNRSENLLLNILPEVVAEELKEKGHADAQLIEHVSVLFTDFRGFTAMSEQLSPKDLVNDLNICFSEFDRIIAEHNIEKIKTIGDAYMAAGGLPIPNTTHAADVVQAAFKMRDFVEAGKARKIEKGLPYFEIRIGIHTGPVVAGIVGVKKFQYDIWGDTVNTASRMESSGEVGKVNISQATYKLLKNDPNFSFEGRGKIEAKGKGEIDMWFVEKN